MTLASTSMPPADGPFNGVATLPHLGILRAQGADAAKFLHGQLTQDFSLLPASQARLAGFLSAKGRMQASFVGWRNGASDSPGDDILLVCSRDVLPAVLQRLSMFVLRAQCRLSDASDAFALRGLAGDAVAAGSPPASEVSPGSAAVIAPPWAVSRAGEAVVVHLYPADGQPRALWMAPAGHPLPSGPALALERWQWGEVQSGIAGITQPLVDAFVPQMLNYESVGGVNFKKGCYPGQEVVARSQFRGTLKRRLYLATSTAAAMAGDTVHRGDAPDPPCGTVVQAAPAPGGGFVLQLSLQIAAAQAAGAGALRLGAADGATLTLTALPYPLLEDL